jgi:hypothetical protein
VNDRGEVRVSEPAPGVVLFVEKGHLSADFVAKILGVYEGAIDPGRRPHIFVDCEALVGYDPPIRTDITAWVRTNHPRVSAIHMLVRSRMAKMGLAVTNLVLGGMLHGYTDRASFQTALHQAVARVTPDTTRVLPSLRTDAGV